MRPRNRNEREVEQLRASLNSLSSPKRFRKSDREWIEKNHTIGNTEYFAIYEVVGDWQVIRMFMYRSWTKRHEALHEPLRYWIKADGSYVLEYKHRQTMGNYYIDAWKWDSELEIRSNSSYYRDVRDLYTNYTRIHSLIPELKRAGFRANDKCVNGLKPFWFVHSLLTNNRVETLFKLRQAWLTWKFYHYDKLTDGLWQSIRVALRHGYHWDSKEEINDWCDMIRDLEYLGLDTRNPHYICPANLQDAHLHWIDAIEKIRQRERGEAERKREIENMERALKLEQTYTQKRQCFLGMVITDGEINISVIPTPKAMIEEGKAMHHCVGGYVEEWNSLILSARIDGKRIETIEVDLRDYHIEQSRGVCNKETSYHNRILGLVNSNMNEIRKRNMNQMKIAV